MNISALNPKELSMYKWGINLVINVATDLYRSFLSKDDKINYKPKENGEYGYYVNRNVFPIIEYIQKHQKKSFLDLGSGAGILLYVLKRELEISHKNIKGYEIEDSLIEVASKLLGNNMTEKKDILTLKKEDIQEYEVLYFWEPLEKAELAKKFVDNLVEILSPNQTILYCCSGRIGYYLKESKKMKHCGNTQELEIWKLA